MNDRGADSEHRVRTELTTIRVAAQLIEREPHATERQKRLAHEIILAASRLQARIQEWLDLEASSEPR